MKFFDFGGINGLWQNLSLSSATPSIFATMRLAGIYFSMAVLVLAGCSKPLPTTQQTVASLQTLNQLATVEYVFTKAIEASDELTWYKVGERRIIITCRASVKAGIDFSKVQATDIRVDGKAIEVTLPPSAIMGINMKPEDLKVAYQETGIFRDRFEPTEINQLMRVGERQISAAAAESDILKQAGINAQLAVDQLLRQAGFEQITITQRPASSTNPPKS